MLSLCPFDISVGIGAFVIGLSQLSSFFSYSYTCLNRYNTQLIHDKHVQEDFIQPLAKITLSTLFYLNDNIYVFHVDRLWHKRERTNNDFL